MFSRLYVCLSLPLESNLPSHPHALTEYKKILFTFPSNRKNSSSFSLFSPGDGGTAALLELLNAAQPHTYISNVSNRLRHSFIILTADVSSLPTITNYEL